MIPEDHSYFQSNIERYKNYDPLAAEIIEKSNADPWRFFLTHVGELNLYKKTEKKNYFYHSPDGALKEAFEWYQSTNFKIYNIAYIFGIGLGYFYEPLKEWLSESPERTVIFLEDDPAVLKRFFETRRAEKLLLDPQVYIQLIPALRKETVSEFQDKLQDIFKAFYDKNGFFSSLPLYSKVKAKECEEIRKQIFFGNKAHQIVNTEMVVGITDTMKNVYYKLLRMEGSVSFSALEGKLKNVPALICGAGPSISKEIPLIKEYQDKVLLIGSGTGANVLTASGIFPHLIMGLDPTSSQASRFRANNAFEVPLCFKMRFSENAYKMHQGPKIYVRGFEGPLDPSWLEKRLGLDDHITIPSGISSSNFAIEIAYRLGCNPIILAGIDMAYKDNKRYPENISAHPGDKNIVREEWGAKRETLFDYRKKDGKIILTKTDWLFESLIISDFQEAHPELQIINSTLEGLPIDRVLELPLNEALRRYASSDQELFIFLQALILRQSPLALDKNHILDTIKEWLKSLNEIVQETKAMAEEIESLSIKKGSLFENEEKLKEKLKGYDKKLKEIIAFPQLKKLYSEILSGKLYSRKKILKSHKEIFSDEEVNELKKRLLVYEYEFYEDIAKRHATILENEIADYEKNVPMISNTQVKPFVIPKKYFFNDTTLEINDSELNIHLKSSFKMGDLKERKTLQEGSLFKISHYLNGKLHGPSLFYGKNQELLAEEWYFDGVKQGKALLFYQSGKVYALLKRKDGKKEGDQVYFFESGIMRSKIHFKNDLLEGSSEFYFPSGQKKREFSFKEGKQEGPEKMWNENGVLIFSGEFQEGKPIKEALSFYDNGILSQRIIFSGFKIMEESEWNNKGELIRHHKHDSMDGSKEHLKALKDLKKEIKKLNQLRGPEKDGRFW